jgi:GTP-binding protein
LSIRNIAIIAHVDHGKTTLVDKMLRQAGVFRDNQQVEERVLDSNPLERERGITILSKNASVRWRGVKINIVDTPGHADFGGEVERILRMVDGVLLLVDAAEGPMPQTRFVTRKAMALGLAPVVVINKVDRSDARPAAVHDEVLELFMDLEASEAQLDAPFLYASARHGVAYKDWSDRRTGGQNRRTGGQADGRTAEDAPPASGPSARPTGPSARPAVRPSAQGGDEEAWPGDLTPLFEAILDSVPPPSGEAGGPFQMLISTLDYSPYLGRVGIGRIERGRVKVGQPVALLPLGQPGLALPEEAAQAKVAQLYGFEGLERVELAESEAGDIVAIAGVEGVEIGHTITDPACLERLRGIAVEEPTISVDFMVNNSPFSGRSGRFVTSRQVTERLFRELERNVALRVEETDRPEVLTVSGRGELHLAILMETMRREGYEFQVSRPRVIPRQGPGGVQLEPYEELVVDVPEAMVGTVMELVGPRRGEMLDMRNPGHGRARMRFRQPARGLFGLRSEFLTETRGEGVMHHRFLEYGPWAGPLSGRTRGVLVADREGVAVAYALWNLEERATLFVGPGEPVYEGMIVGEHVRPGDLDVNVTREKKLTNMRTTASDENIQLTPARELTLEAALEYIEDDELIEVTPDSIRLRKRQLAAVDRKKAARRARAAEQGS